MKRIIFIHFLILLAFQGVQAQNKWWNQTTAYEIFVRSFYDSNGDGIGDFNGITQKIDYLNNGNGTANTDLGVGLVWLMPINASPSYHGYDVTNYLALNPQYGTINQFQAMLTEAHKRGIKVIMDFVINHCSDQHPWFVKSAANDPFYRDFFRWETTAPNQIGPWGQQVWYSKNGSNYYALFWSGMPDLNYNYQPVKDSIFAAAKFWINEIGVDGFRLDAASYIFEEGNVLKHHPKTIAFWKEFNDSCKSWKPNSLLIGEVWDTPEYMALYTGKLDMVFDFNLAGANLDAASTGNPYNSRVAINTGKTIFKPNQFGSFLTNHDQDRIIDVFNGDINKNKVAASLLLTQAGVPFIYYGEEVGMKGSKPDENIRRPMQWNTSTYSGFTTGTPWRSLNTNYATFNVSTLQNDSNSLWSHYQKLIKIRNENEALQIGEHKNLISTHNEVHSYLRSSNGNEIVVLVNTTNSTISELIVNVVRADGKGGNYLITDLLDYSNFVSTSNGNQFSFKVDLAPYQTKILSFGYPTGIQEFAKSTFSAYPNPTKNNFKISLANNQLPANMELFNLSGELIKKAIITESQTSYDIDVNQGFYILNIWNDSGFLGSKKICIQP
jgi:alpha-amylase